MISFMRRRVLHQKQLTAITQKGSYRRHSEIGRIVFQMNEKDRVNGVMMILATTTSSDHHR